MALPPLPRSAAPVSLGEGCTPLLRHRVAAATALLKCEWFMPTGSSKDRGASVMLSGQEIGTATLERTRTGIYVCMTNL